MQPAYFALKKILSDLTKVQKVGESKVLADFLSRDFIALFCLFSVTKAMSTFPYSINARTGIILIQKHAQLKSTLVQQARTRNISLAFRTKISIFSGFKEQLGLGPYMSLLTDEQEQRGSSFNYYGSQIFPSQITNEEPSSRSISPEPTSSIADASAAAAQKKKQYTQGYKEMMRMAHEQFLEILTAI